MAAWRLLCSLNTPSADSGSGFPSASYLVRLHAHHLIMSSFRTSGKKIVAIGRNYAAHIKELNNTQPTEPFFFLKPTSSYITGGQAVEIPRNVVVHHEGAQFGCLCLIWLPSTDPRACTQSSSAWSLAKEGRTSRPLMP